MKSTIYSAVVLCLLATLFSTAPASAEPRLAIQVRVVDQRHGPRHYYPARGYYVRRLPRHAFAVRYRVGTYYYADHIYYRWLPRQQVYVVTEPPEAPDGGMTTPLDYTSEFVYPARGQSEAQQADDRYACYQWAVKQTGFDPTQPSGGVASGQAAAYRADYQRAESACLEARGYTVK
ncbi:MAG: hypothetical protein R3F24_10815 [Gammaproteobacteria bacterium]